MKVMRTRMLAPAPACMHACMRTMHMAIPVGPVKNTWQRKGTGYAHTTSFLCWTFQPPSKIEKIALPTHAASSCYMTDTITIIVFLNKSFMLRPTSGVCAMYKFQVLNIIHNCTSLI